MVLLAAFVQAPSTTPPRPLISQSTESLTATHNLGKIQGVVTYYFNVDVGVKVDLWSQVFLVSGTVDAPNDKAIPTHRPQDNLTLENDAT